MFKYNCLAVSAILLVLTIPMFGETVNRGTNSGRRTGELLSGGDFEKINNFSDLINNGWGSTFRESMKDIGLEVAINSTVSHSGKKSVMLKSSIPRVLHISTPYLTVASGAKINVSVWVKLDAVKTGAKAYYKARLGYFCYDKDKKIIPGGAKSFYTKDGTVNWENIKRTITCPAGTKFLKIYAELKVCTGTLYIDDLSITALGDASSPVKTTSIPVKHQMPKLTSEKLSDMDKIMLADMAAKFQGNGKIIFSCESFEKYRDSSHLFASGWNKISGGNSSITLTDRIAHSGKKSIFITSQDARITHISTPKIRVNENVKINISSWLKLDNVVTGKKGYFKARSGIFFLDKAGKVLRSGSKVFITKDGSTDWLPVNYSTYTLPGTHYIKLWAELKKTTGNIYWDDLVVVQVGDGVSLKELFVGSNPYSAQPIIIPKPLKENYTALFDPGRKVKISYFADDQIIQEQMTAFLTRLGAAEVKDNSFSTHILIGRPTDKDISAILGEAYLKSSATNLGKQGYLVYAAKVGAKHIIVLCSTGRQGRYFAWQSLKQMPVYQNGRYYLMGGTIIDKPGYKERGMVFGSIQRWYEGPYNNVSKKFEGWSYRRRFQALKFNLLFLAGNGLASYHQMAVPFSQSVIDNYAKLYDDCQKYYIDAMVGVRPYRQKPRPGREKGGVVYSSEKDIKGVADNLITLYKIGFRSLYIAEDDMVESAFLQYKQDKERFRNQGEAHAYFVGEIYKRVKKSCPDFRLIFCATAYSGDAVSMPESYKTYCRSMARMPLDISLVYTQPDSKSVTWYRKLTGGRKIHTWSNFYTVLYGYKKYNVFPVFPMPYGGGDATLDKYTESHFFLITDKPTSMISTFTAADYMWNPARYQARKSFKRAFFKVRRLLKQMERGEKVEQYRLDQFRRIKTEIAKLEVKYK
ncbi:MAG: protein O-GlcNAcase [Victivallaceae bacterium]|nr:protein O-GlcNAcase [Victivallaceae bacterium]